MVVVFVRGEKIGVFGFFLMFCFLGWVLIRTRLFSLLITKKFLSCVFRMCAFCIYLLYFNKKLFENSMKIYGKI